MIRMTFPRIASPRGKPKPGPFCEKFPPARRVKTLRLGRGRTYLGGMAEIVISVRMARPGDEDAIARVHDAAWRDAYSGIIPGRELERMVQRRGPAWWRRAIRAGTRLIVLDFADSIAGYASYGRNRMPALPYGGEIFELYLAPEYQGVGLGRRMFEAASADLAAHGFPNFVVWALGENERALDFYQRRGGAVVRRARERFGAETRERLAFGFG